MWHFALSLFLAMVLLSSVFLANIAAATITTPIQPPAGNQSVTDQTVAMLNSNRTNSIANSVREIFIAKLTGDAEVPPADTSATATAEFELLTVPNSTSYFEFKYKLNDIDLNNITAAHIHNGRVGENGPIILTLYNKANSTEVLSRITSDNFEGLLAGKQLSDLVSAMKNGETYVNIHTSEFPNGEIRGQILAGTSVAGVVYLDKNTNGERDAGEPGMTNFSITVLDNDYDEHEVFTTSDGSYSSNVIVPGYVAVGPTEEPEGHLQIQPKNITGDNSYVFDNLTSLTRPTDVDFGYASFTESGASISGVVYVDKNGNGIRDTGEPVVPNANITIRDRDSDHQVVTAANGSYSLLQKVVPSERVIVWSETPEGYFVTQPAGREKSYWIEDLSPGDTREDINFGYASVSDSGVSISGVAYLDKNANGRFDTNDSNTLEPGLANVLITMDDVSGYHETLSGSDGSYHFDAIPGEIQLSSSWPSNRSLYITQPRDIHMYGSSFGVSLGNLSAGQNRTDINFGYAPTSEFGASISGVVYADKNANGIRDPGEPGLPNVDITFYHNNIGGNHSVSAADGSYTFSKILPIEGITLSAEMPKGYFIVQPAGGRMGIDNITARDNTTDVNFGFSPLADTGVSISGIAYIDGNANGVRDAEELGMPNASITIRDDHGEHVVSSEKDGSFSLKGVVPGRVTLSTKALQNGFFVTQPEAQGQESMSYALNVTQGENITDTNLLFGYTSLADNGVSMQGIAYVDENANGMRDDGEPPMPNVTIAANNIHGIKETVSASEDGSYSFEELPVASGGLEIQAKTPEGYFVTTPNITYSSSVGSSYSFNNLTWKENPSGVDFGYALLTKSGASVSGVVYSDQNANGVRDDGEPPMPNVTIAIEDRHGSHKETVSASEDGSYFFREIVPGDIKLSTKTLEGLFLTQPAAHRSALFNYYYPEDIGILSVGQNRTGIDFGYASLSESGASVSGIVYVDENVNGIHDAGEPGMANSAITVGDDHGQHKIVPAANGSYSLEGVVPGGFVRIWSETPEGYLATQPEGGDYYSLDDIAVKQSRKDVNFGYTKAAVLQVNVTDESGNNVTGINIGFTDATTGEFVDTIDLEPSDLTPKPVLVYWLPGQKVKATVDVGDSLYQSIINGTIFALEKGKNSGDIVLKRIQEAKLRGNVTDVHGKPIENFVVTASQNIDQRSWFYSDATDKAGRYNMTLLEGEAEIQGANSDYVVEDQTVMITALSDNTTEAEVLNLSAKLLPTYNITADVNIKYIGSAWQKIDRNTGGVPMEVIDAFGNRNPGAAPSPVQIRGLPEDEVNICVYGAQLDLSNDCQMVRLDDNRNVSSAFYLAEHGRIHGRVVDGITGEPVPNWVGNLYSVNATGYRTSVVELSNASEIFDFSVPQAGNYQMDIFSGTGSGDQIISSGREEQQKHFGQMTVSVADGSIANAGDVKVYKQTAFGRDGSSGNVDAQAANSLVATPFEVAPGSVLTLRAQYANNGNKTIDNATLLLEVPANTALVNGSVTLNGKQDTRGKELGSYYEMPLGNLESELSSSSSPSSPATSSSGVASYQIRLNEDFNATSMDITARMSYFMQFEERIVKAEQQDHVDKQKGKVEGQEEIIGVAHIVVPDVSIDAPEHVPILNTTVSGRAPVGSTVQVHDGNVVLGEARSSSAGLWNMAVTLPDTGSPSLHTLHAQVKTKSLGTLYSQESPILYDPSSPLLLEVCMQQTDGQRVCFDPSKGVARFPYRLQIHGENRAFTFELKFNNPEAVSDEFVILGGKGGGLGNATLGDDGISRARIFPNVFDGLGPIFVGYTTELEKGNKSSAIPIPSPKNRTSEVVGGDGPGPGPGPGPDGGDGPGPGPGPGPDGGGGDGGGDGDDGGTQRHPRRGGDPGEDPKGDPDWNYDPSGYVYEAIPSNRLENVSTTALFKNYTTNTLSPWDAADYGQINPQSTDPQGLYGWDVPEGDWQVIYEKPGYQQAKSQIMHVPPPRTEVNIGMMSQASPNVTAVSAVVSDINANGSSSVNVLFEKYVPISNLTNSSISVWENNDSTDITIPNKSNGQGMMTAGKIVPINPAADINGTLFTRQVRFIPTQPLLENGTYTVLISKEIQSYSGIPMVEDYRSNTSAVKELEYLASINILGNNTSSSELTLSQLLTANSTTNDLMSPRTTFVWYGPDVDGNENSNNTVVIDRETVEASSNSNFSPRKLIAQSSPFMPTETGTWSVQALFTDGNNIFQTRSISFNVTELSLEEEEELVPPITTSLISNTYNLTIGDKTYPIQYNITGGELNSVSANTDQQKLEINITSTVGSQNGTLTIGLPRNIIDSVQLGDNNTVTDIKYSVSIDGQDAIFEEIASDNQSRILSIDFQKDAQQIKIIGTKIVPQFGISDAGLIAAIAIILTIAIIGTLIAIRRYRSSIFGPKH